MKIHVTADDIRAGRRYSASHCPVALALRRTTNQDWWVGDVDANDDADDDTADATVLSPCVGDDEKAPGSVHQFRQRFDRGEPVEPFAFDLD